MEAGKQKTQRERDGADGPKKKVRVVEARDDVEVEAPPSEAEVEEFFAIVRRMHVAVKYFGQKANGVDGKRPGKWRAALEAEEVVMVAAAEAPEVLDDKETVKKALATATTPAPAPAPAPPPPFLPGVHLLLVFPRPLSPSSPLPIPSIPTQPASRVESGASLTSKAITPSTFISPFIYRVRKERR